MDENQKVTRISMSFPSDSADKQFSAQIKSANVAIFYVLFLHINGMNIIHKRKKYELVVIKGDVVGLDVGEYDVL